MSEAPCISTITSEGGRLLPPTGIDASLWVHVAVVAGALVFVGLLTLLVHHRRTRPLAVLAVVVFAVAVFVIPSPPAQAAPSPEAPCALIQVDDIAGQRTSTLTPGDTADGLRYRVTNVTAFPIDVRVSTTVTSDPGAIAAHLNTTITTRTPVTTSPAVPLSASPVSPAIRLEPGQAVTTSYVHTLEDTAGNTVQGHAVLYDSTITAAQITP